MTRKKEHKNKSNKKKVLIKTLLLIFGLAIVLFIILNLTGKEAIISINGQKIMRDYVDKQLFMNFQDSQMDYEEKLNQTINKVLLLQDAKKKGIYVYDKEVETGINNFLANRMLTKKELESRLKSQEISFDDFKNNYKEQMIINKLLNTKIFADIRINDVDVALYYKEHRKEINQSFDDVKEVIKKNLEQNKKQELLNNYLEGLRSNAKIEYLGEYKKIKEMEEFAKCLSNKSVLYGSSWCPHCKSQKEMFGPFIKYINFVDCEANIENQNECILKGIQAYPTWEINNQLLIGEKKFKELSKLSGCTFNQ